ncbi:hypothetical protein JS530_03015 [Bifidobacterium sp. LC6]|uniref:Uncharacterized protein n=1 Tax=Bifidobacterium colobi TaxID=2809026 RepID=A0ABS5UUQ7_9BIFI|nr:hypothetical protein [Bifidobacterium colobi]MBT1174488.1 hypothetical protein [Bifidobacterium colobi]
MQTATSMGVDDSELQSLGSSLHDASNQVDAITDALKLSSASVGQQKLAAKVSTFIEGSAGETLVFLAMMARLENFLDQVVVSTSEVDGKLSVEISGDCVAPKNESRKTHGRF